MCLVPPSSVAGITTVEVSMDGKTYTSNLRQFVYIETPHIVSVNPKTGPVSGRTLISIEGSNFSNVGSLSCTFGDPCVIATFINSKNFLCLSPSHDVSSSVQVERQTTIISL